jgi:hypothetical protein
MKLAWHAVAILALGAGLSHAQPVTIVNDVGDVPPGYCEAQPPATCYYVDPVNGDDGAPGSFAQPWRTMVNFNESIYQGFRPPTWVGLSPGDVVYLMEGVHNTIYHPGGDGGPDDGGSCIVWFQSLHGTADHPILVRNYPGHHAILDPGLQGEGVVALSSSYIHIRGLHIRNAYHRGLLYRLGDHGWADHLLISETDGLADANIAGVEMAYSEDVELSDSIIYDNYDRTAAQSGTNTSNSCNMVIFDNTGVTSIHDNIFFQTGDATSEFSGCGVKYKHASSEPSSTFEVYRNYFENHKYVHLGVGTHNANIHHNIMAGGTAPAISSEDWGGATHIQHQSISHNTFYGTGGFFVSPTLAWVNEPNGPWADLTANAFEHNILYDTHTGYDLETRPVLFSAYMSDALYDAWRVGITLDDNCYYNPALGMSFGFAEDPSYGTSGGVYDLAGWRTAYGWDLSSRETEPLFVDATGLDFTPQSPDCVDKGALAGGDPIKTAKIYSILGIDDTTSQPTLVVDDATLTEGQSGTTGMTITVTLSEAGATAQPDPRSTR